MARTFVRASSQYLENAAAVLTGGPLTLAFWFNTDDAANAQTGLSIRNAATGDGWRLNIQGNVGSVIRAQSTGSTISVSASTSTSYSTNTWSHACGVFASTSSRAAYLNGGGKGTESTLNVPLSVDTTTIGRHSSGTGNYVSGLLALPAIWNIALSDSDVSILSKAYAPWLVHPEALVACWPLIGRTTAEIDVVGGFDMTVVGATQGAHPRIIYPRPRQQVGIAAAAATTRPVKMAGEWGGFAGAGGGFAA